MRYNPKMIIYVFLTLFLGIGSVSAWAKTHEDRGKEIGKKLDEAEKSMKEKTREEKKKAKEKAKEEKQKLKEKAHEGIDKF